MLDFSIDRDVDRVEYVKTQLPEHHTQKDLETFANYILFGKDEEGKSEVDKKNIEIETKYKSFSKRTVESLDELEENINFDERTVRPISRSRYNNPKPTLDRNLDEIRSLSEEIGKWEYRYNVAIGRVRDDSLPPRTQTQIYKLKHFLIELKRQQYLINEELSHRLNSFESSKVEAPQIEETLEVLPLGLKIGKLERFDNPKNDRSTETIEVHSSTPINLEDPSHIYAILELYPLLLENSIENPYGNCKYLVETIDFYIDLANLDASRATIVELKKRKTSNKDIQLQLEKLYGVSYNENYISTIYTKEICKKIANAVSLHYAYWMNRFEEGAWKKCSCCGQWKLRDSREFTKNKSSLDGYSNKCKECSRKKRLERKSK